MYKQNKEGTRTYCMPGIALCESVLGLFHPYNNPTDLHYYIHFTDLEIDVQQGLEREIQLVY